MPLGLSPTGFWQGQIIQELAYLISSVLYPKSISVLYRAESSLQNWPGNFSNARRTALSFFLHSAMTGL